MGLKWQTQHRKFTTAAADGSVGSISTREEIREFAAVPRAWSDIITRIPTVP